MSKATAAKNIWLSDAAAYPLFAVMGAAMGLLGYKVSIQLTQSNDIAWTHKGHQAALRGEPQVRLPWQNAKNYDGFIPGYGPSPRHELLSSSQLDA